MLRYLRDSISFHNASTISSVLLYNSLSWYFIGNEIVRYVAQAFTGVQSDTIALAYPISIIIAGLVGAGLNAKGRSMKFLRIWLLLGLIASLLPGLPWVAQWPTALIFVLIIGSSLGLGMPSCFSYFADSVHNEERGKLGGIVFVFTTLTLPVLFLTPNLTSSLISSVIVFAIWRAWGFLLFSLSAGDQSFDMPSKRERSFPSVLADRNFRLYFAAWLMLALVDSFASQLLFKQIMAIPSWIKMMEPAIAGISALVAGILSDRIGRRRIVIFGFVSLGVAYAILGISKDVLGWIPLHVYTFYFAVDGLALGLLWVLFTIVLWGDLSLARSTEKFYAIGNTPLFLSEIVAVVSASTLLPTSVSVPIFTLAAFFLFLSVVPLFYAEETLSGKIIQERQLKMYTGEALRLKQKVEQKQK
jgi:MFS family permease